MARLRFLLSLLLSLVASQSAVQAQTDDDAAWQTALAAGTVDSFEMFLRQYPTSRHASEAFGKLVMLETLDDNPDVFHALQAGGLLGTVRMPETMQGAPTSTLAPSPTTTGTPEPVAPALTGPTIDPAGDDVFDIY